MNPRTRSLRRLAQILCVTACAVLPWAVPGTAAAAAPSFMAFESGPVRPVAMSPDRTRLFVANTPNNTLEVFNITPAGLEFALRVPVGLEPVAVAAASDTEVWVVNHLSDSVSVVSLSGTPRVVRTLLVGDEPRDIVFAGSPARAFITTAHRGQQLTDPSLAGVPGAGDPKLTTPGIGRADVWVFDPANLGTAMGGKPLRIMNFFADTPRALAVSPDRGTVYVAAFKSGNQTTTLIQELVCNGFKANQTCVHKGQTMPGGNHGPRTNVEGKPAPETSLIVKYNKQNGRWEDSIGRNWSNAVRLKLPDLDVFAVNANSLTQTASYASAGTILYNMVANPVSGNLYVSNTESNNLARFEGPGVFGGSTVQGNLSRSQVTVISPSQGVAPRHLNKHIDYSKLVGKPGFDPTVKAHTLATPTDMVVSRDGRSLYVAAFGSSRIGVYATAQLEANTFDPRSASAAHIDVSGGGPSGLVLDEDRGRLYVTTRFDNAVKVIDLASKAEVARSALPNPEPAHIVEGRPFLYDAKRSSANGEASCSSCHTFGDADDLAWDLGNPDDVVTSNPMKMNLSSPAGLALGKLLFGVKTPVNGSDKVEFHPMKGPMTTQTLRGMRNSGAMHWRGDRSNGAFGQSGTDSRLSFKNFAVAFEGLLGNPAPLGEAEMNKFADFQLSVQLPPNPVRKLDNTLTPSQARGARFYNGPRPSDGINLRIADLLAGEKSSFTCEGCHRLNPAQGFFGTGGEGSFEGIPQLFKIPHLRNMYQKVGMFGGPKTDFFSAPDSGPTGDQVRGFGYTNDGAVDTMFRFFTAKVFDPQLNAGFPLINPDATRRDVVDYMMAFDSDLAPIVGQQVTLTRTNAAAAGPRIDLLVQRAQANFVSKELGGATKECELVANVAQAGAMRGFLYDPVARNFVAADGTRRSDAVLRAMAGTDGQEVTYTCTPPGSGSRIAFQR